jgi:glyoxylase-like metal-dependent hydrolase (beta-lactamase superfamily II)
LGLSLSARLLFLAVLGLGAWVGCAAAPEPKPAEVSQRKSLAERHAEDPRVGRYVSAPWSFSTASYWIEGPEGVVVIDTQFVFSAAEELIADAERITGKKVVLAVVLHANPDKFNGTEVFQRRGIKVVTSEQVLAQLPKIHEKRVAAFYDRYKPDYPLDLPKPDAFGGATTEISAGGVTLKLHVLGPACSEAHVVAEFEGHLFAGDMLASGVHSWLEIGRTDEWLKRLDELEALKPRFVHPGRGVWGGAGLIGDERDYLRAVVEAVAAEKPQGEPDEAALARVEAALVARYPKHRFAVFLNIGLPAEWRRQAAAASQP